MLSNLAGVGASILAVQGSGLVQNPITGSNLANPTATIEAGTIVGTTTTVPSSDVTVNKFLGVPFAASPPERFLPPKPAPKFGAPYPAQAWKPACMQQFSYPKNAANKAAQRAFEMAIFGGEPTAESEDCLYLNVYAPDTPDENKTVMVWLFGGGMKLGHAGQALYDGSNMAANQDVIVVTINYRTNVFGFSNSPAIPFTDHNAGFYDQRQALDWVQRNIAAFGGDPSKVTLFGQSAGSKSVDRIVLSPPEPVPFRAAILQSGTATFDGNTPNSTSGWDALVSALKCQSQSGDQSDQERNELICVQQADALAIKNTIEQNDLTFVQYVDGITKLSTPVNRTVQQTVPIMVGTNGQESRVFTLGENNLVNYCIRLYPNNDRMQGILEKHYAVGSAGLPTDYDAIAQIATERNYQCGAALTANYSETAGFDTWRYYFNAAFANTNKDAALAALGYPDSNLEAFHSSEIAYVFGALPSQSTPEQYELSQYMQKAWAQFAKDPTNGPGWESYGSGLQMLGQADSATSELIDKSVVDGRCSLWKKHLLYNPSPEGT